MLKVLFSMCKFLRLLFLPTDGAECVFAVVFKDGFAAVTPIQGEVCASAFFASDGILDLIIAAVPTYLELLVKEVFHFCQ